MLKFLGIFCAIVFAIISGQALIPVFDSLNTVYSIIVLNLILSLYFTILILINTFIQDKKDKNLENKIDEILKITSFDVASIHTANKILRSKSGD